MFYFDPLVQAEIKRKLKLIRGNENKDDARQEAYHEIADTEPLTVEDAVQCVCRAIDRYRKRIIKISKREIGFGAVRIQKHDKLWQMTQAQRCGLDDIEDDNEDEYTNMASWIDKINTDLVEPPKRGPAYYKKLYSDTCKEIATEKNEAM